MMIIGIAMQFLNILTYGLWGIDIDIFGAMIFIIGLAITIACWKKKEPKPWLKGGLLGLILGFLVSIVVTIPEHNPILEVGVPFIIIGFAVIGALIGWWKK